MILEILLLFSVLLNAKVIQTTFRNYRYMKSISLGGFKDLCTGTKKVSVMIPARNEEANIQKCVESLLDQSYPNFEIIVLNDKSTDRTGEILDELVKKHPKLLRVIHGVPLEPGWMGKCFACHQLSKSAKGDYFLFLDADVVATSKDLLKGLVGISQSRNVELVSLGPLQIMESVGEIIGISLFLYNTTSFSPVPEYNDPKYPNLAAANGQCIMFTKDLYEQIGGHALVKDSIIEDVAFGRIVKANNIPIFYGWGKGYVNCRMYDSFSSFQSGLTKNLAAYFRILKFKMLFPFVNLIVIIYPFLLVLFSVIGVQLVSSWVIWISGLSFLLNALLYGWIANTFGSPSLPVLPFFVNFPISIYTFYLCAIALAAARGGKLVWKGRVYSLNDFEVKKIDFKKRN